MKELICRLFNIKLKTKTMDQKVETPVTSINEQSLNEQRKNEALYQKEKKLEAQVKNLIILNDTLQNEVEIKNRLIDSLNFEIEKRDDRARLLAEEISNLKLTVKDSYNKINELVTASDNKDGEIKKLNEKIIEVKKSLPSHNEKNPENIKPLDYVSPKDKHDHFEIGYNCRVVSVNEENKTMIIRNHDNKDGHKSEIEVSINDFKKI